MRIVFMGTPEFAVATLNAIFQSEHQVVAVVTAPDKPCGRGLRLQPSDVKKFAIEHQIPILQPIKLKDPDFIHTLIELHADVFVVVAFRMLPEAVYRIPTKGTFNIHASLLPDYRGAAPIHHAIMNGETQTGVTAFFLNHAIDEGDIIDSVAVPIGPCETTGELYDKLMIEGAHLAVKTLDKISSDNVHPRQQIIPTNRPIFTAPKITKEILHIDWNQNSHTIFNKIRALSPYPGAYSIIHKKSGEIFTIKWFESEITSIASTKIPGTIHTDGKKFLYISTGDYLISIQKLQIEGKPKRDIKEFLTGFHIEIYTDLLE